MKVNPKKVSLHFLWSKKGKELSKLSNLCTRLLHFSRSLLLSLSVLEHQQLFSFCRDCPVTSCSVTIQMEVPQTSHNFCVDFHSSVSWCGHPLISVHQSSWILWVSLSWPTGSYVLVTVLCQLDYYYWCLYLGSSSATCLFSITDFNSRSLTPKLWDPLSFVLHSNLISTIVIVIK